MPLYQRRGNESESVRERENRRGKARNSSASRYWRLAVCDCRPPQKELESAKSQRQVCTRYSAGTLGPRGELACCKKTQTMGAMMRSCSTAKGRRRKNKNKTTQNTNKKQKPNNNNNNTALHA